MGEVALTFKVMPDGIEVPLDELRGALEEKLSEGCRLQSIEEKPVAFGLKALMVKLVVEDGEGVLDKVEDSIRGISGVQSAQIEEMGRLMRSAPTLTLISVL